MFLLRVSLLSTLISSSAFAAEPTVKITSFVYANAERKLAELCGVVSDMSASPTYVRITVDPNTSRPGVYNTFAGGDGKFCLTVITHSGMASARAWD